jgi:hypothetical protein
LIAEDLLVLDYPSPIGFPKYPTIVLVISLGVLIDDC